jgi:hypothetical protein
MPPSRSVLTNVFIEQLLGFLNELKEMYPEDPDFPLGISSIRMLKNVNPSMIPKYFYESAKTFESEIVSKNEKFFLDHSFGNDVDFDLLSKLKQYVAGMSPTSKDNVWAYIQTLFKLSKTVANS